MLHSSSQFFFTFPLLRLHHYKTISVDAEGLCINVQKKKLHEGKRRQEGKEALMAAIDHR